MNSFLLSKQSIGVLLYLLLCNKCYAQKKEASAINRNNYFNFLIPTEKVFYLSEGEIKIILDGELKTLGVPQKNWHGEFVLIGKEKTIVDKTKQGKVIAWLVGSPIPVWHGLFLDQSKSSFQQKENFNVNADTAVFKFKEAHDPIELPYSAFKQSRYWYQQKKDNQKKEIVSRAAIVQILRDDIKQLVEIIR